MAVPLHGQRYFEFVVSECNSSQRNNFIALTSDTAVINLVENELALPERQRMLFIIGFIDHGNGGFNLDWNWHFKPSQWTLTFNSIEVCDGCPQFVEDNLDYWVGVLGQFCPWGGRVSREVFPTAIPANIPEYRNKYLIDNYPNPFNNATMINYQLPITSYIELSVYNLLGQKVVNLVDEKQGPGKYHVQWDASGLASGLYYYIYNAGKFQQIKKMILIK